MRRTRNSLCLFVSLLPLLPWAAQAQQATLTVPLSATQYRLNRLAPGQTQAQTAVTVDQANRLTVEVTANVCDLATSVVTPGGQELNSATVGSVGGTFSLVDASGASASLFISPSLSPGFHYFYSLPLQGVGSYTIRLQAPANLNQEVAVVTQVSTDSRLAANLFSTAPTPVLGDPVVLSGLLLDNQTPVLGANFAVTVQKEDGTQSLQITLLDNGVGADALAGDGLYSGEFTATATGTYQGFARITGRSAAGNDFQREAGASFTVTPLTGRFNGALSDRGVDDNGNGKFERLKLSLQTEVGLAGNYRAFVELGTASGKKLLRSAQTTLVVGSQVVDVDFPAADIVQLNENDPYVVNRIGLAYLDSSEPTQTDVLGNLGQTQAYNLSQFELAQLFFTNANTVSGVDTNGNGRFNLLRVAAEVQTATAGSYSWSGSLFDGAGVEIGFYSSSSSLPAGRSVINFDFDGSRIGRNGVDGPYFVKSVLLFGSGLSITVPNLVTTPAFSAEQFEGALTLRLNPASVVGGNPVAGTITLPTPAPTGGVQVALSSSASVASVPATVSVPQGATGANFTVTTASVPTPAQVNVSATAVGATRSAPLSVVPANPLSIGEFSPTSGRPGTVVTLRGTGFNGVTQVRFYQNKPATFTVVSDTEITAIVPSDATTGTIRLDGAGGARASSSGKFTVTP